MAQSLEYLCFTRLIRVIANQMEWNTFKKAHDTREKNELASNVTYSFDLRRLLSRIHEQKMNIEDIIFEFRKITYKYKLYGPGGIRTAKLEDLQYQKYLLWVYAHFSISYIISHCNADIMKKFGRSSSSYYCVFMKSEMKTDESPRDINVKINYDILSLLRLIKREFEFVKSGISPRDYDYYSKIPTNDYPKFESDTDLELVSNSDSDTEFDLDLEVN